MSELDPIEQRRRQREAANRRTLTLAILAGGAVMAGLIVFAAVMVVGKKGSDVGGGGSTSDPAFVAGAIVTVEGTVGLRSASPGNDVLGTPAKVVVIMTTSAGRDLTCVFPPETYGERWHHDTRRGDTVKVTGRVDEVYERSVRIVDCKFVSQTLRK